MPEASSQARSGGASAPPKAPAQTVDGSDTIAGAAPPPGGVRRSSYLPQLDGLRAIAVIMVFLHHAYSISLLWSGVDLFFILSGYLITNILLRDSARMSFGSMLGHFYLRRAQRILPAYVLCILLISMLVPQNWHPIWPYYAFFLQNVPFALHLIGTSPLIPLWSLAVEQHFYLVWPFLVFFLPRRALPPMMLALLLAVPVLRTFCTPLFPTPDAIYALTPFRIDAMAAGALAALWVPRFRPEQLRRWALAAIAIGLLAYLVLGMHPWFRRSANTPEFNGLAYTLNILILGGLFLWTLLARPESGLNHLLASSPMRALGRISYAFYLFHLAILNRFETFPGLPARLVAPLAFLLSVACATLSWYLVEKPILALGGKPKGASLKPQQV